jgi:EAL domain-containing protein (putative c-di-GMP-specific phosphodiesterase class I)
MAGSRGSGGFPFVEIKVDRAFVGGCAHDRLKRNVCRQIVDLVSHYGARAVAEGVETRADFIAARDLGFDLIQGFLFARPMDLRQFTRTVTGQPVTMPRAAWPLTVANAE